LAIYIPDEKISEIKNSADIIDIISEAVILKKTGRNFVGLCPFHSEKTPSFTVSPEKQIFHCFGCGTGGNVFTFLMKFEGFSFPEAARTLAIRYGIEIPEKKLSPQRKREIYEREHIFDANRQAAIFFRENLHRATNGKKALTYLFNRGMSEETINRFGLGYAPADWDRLARYFVSKHIPTVITEKAGLIIPRKHKSGYYDRFRNRIVFPIVDLNKQVIGFGGRVMDDTLPKYLNSPETPVYNKSKSLYGLNRAKNECRALEEMYVVEGYFDVLTMQQYGLYNSVATLGTALTPEHVQIIRGHIGRSGKVILVFDSDDAGIKAAQRSLTIFEKGFVDARILILPSTYDPDSFLLEFGVDRFKDAAVKALAIMPFLIESAVKKHGLSIEGKLRILSELKGSIARIDDTVARSLYAKALAERIDVDENAVMEKIREATLGHRMVPAAISMKPDALHGPRKETSGDQQYRDTMSSDADKLERKIITMMLQYPKILPEIIERDLLEYFENATLKSIGRIVITKMENQETPVSDILTTIDDRTQRRIIASMVIGEDAWNRKGCARLISQFMDARRDRKSRGYIEKQIKEAEEKNDQDLLLKLLTEKQKMAVLNEKQKMAMLHRDK